MPSAEVCTSRTMKLLCQPMVLWAACTCMIDLIHFTSALADRSEFIDQLLNGYDRRVPPNFETALSTEVTCDMYVASVDSISESSMDYSMSLFLRQRWSDPRLSFDHMNNDTYVTLDAHMAASIWVPDLFFPNEKASHFHDVTVPNRYVRIHSNGTLFYSARISLRAACPMNLHKFPLDTQICSFMIESYAYTTDKLHFRWRQDVPVEVADDLELPQFTLTDYQNSDCTKIYDTGTFPCLKVEFVLKRDVGFFLIQTFIPSALVVILSWVSFWINIEAVPARISLGVLTILTMTTQTTGSRQDLPRVSYVKAIDVWMTTCLCFVFAALLEFAIVNVLSRKEVPRLVMLNVKHKTGPSSQENSPASAKPRAGGVNLVLNALPSTPAETFVIDPEGKEKARKVDKWSRKGFPTVFVAFNLVYWLTYIFWQPDTRL